jgi:CubicO group peptidase (beta-lactamase class C family)
MNQTSETPDWLTAALGYIPQWLGYQMRISGQPGCAVALAYQGRIVLDEAFGHADLAQGIALTPRHRFRVASHSKSFTTAAILKLREQGRVKLDDTAGQYVSGLHPDVATATISQLLSHTSGLFRDGLDSSYWAGRAPFSDEASLRADLTLPPVIDANTRMKYSNHGYGLAGLVIEAITGEPYNVWVQREIVDPAGLSETTPDVPLPEGTLLARGHGGKILLGHHVIFPGDQSTHALAAATGFVSTAADLARWFAQLCPNAATSVLSPNSRREMTRGHVPYSFPETDLDYGLGTNSGSSEGWDWFGHGGGFQGYITRTRAMPKQELAISMLSNTAGGLSPVWIDGVTHILKRFSVDGAPTPKTADWTGRWWSTWGATDVVPFADKVLLADPSLIKPFQHAPELAITGPDEARIVEAPSSASYGEPVRRIRNAAGEVVQMRIASGRAVPEAALAAELLGGYAHAPV